MRNDEERRGQFCSFLLRRINEEILAARTDDKPLLASARNGAVPLTLYEFLSMLSTINKPEVQLTHLAHAQMPHADASPSAHSLVI